MNRLVNLALMALTGCCATALAQPTITSLGNRLPLSVSDGAGGIYYVATGGARWTLIGPVLTFDNFGGGGHGGKISADGRYITGSNLNVGPQVLGNVNPSVTPPFTSTPTLNPAVNQPASTEFDAARYDTVGPVWKRLGGLPTVGSLHVFGSSSSGGSSGIFNSPNSMSSNGRFIVGQAYSCQYSSSAGTAITANTFQWRPYIYDADANGGLGAYTVLPTPFRTSSNTWRRRTGAGFGVSDDGLVICGYQEHNVSTGAAADPDGARPVVWRWNAGTNQYDMVFLPGGQNGSGLFQTASATAGSMHMNRAGTIIVGRSIDTTGNNFIAKWVWNAGTSTWDAPINIGGALAAPATWLPTVVTSCGLPPTLDVTCMTDDGNTIMGSARYSTCGSFMTGGWIWTAAGGIIQDWYDYNVALGTPGVNAAGPYAPIGDPTPGDGRGLPRLGTPLGCSSDGNAIVGGVLGPQLIPGAPGWIIQRAGGPACVPATMMFNPTTPNLYTACSSSIFLNAFAMGTLPITYQWFKDGNQINDGPSGFGSNYVGTTTFGARVNPTLTPNDAGNYHAVATGPCGAPSASAISVVQVDPAFPAAANDTCLTAQAVGMGTNVLVPAQSPCGAYIDEPDFTACTTNSIVKADRWFSFTPGVTGNYRLETCGANYDTVLSIFTTCGGTELACNNDYTSGPSTGCTSTRSRISSINLTGSTTYLIRLSAPTTAFLSTTSTMNLSIMNAPVIPANDSCAAAIPAVLAPAVNAYNTTEATADGIAALACASTSNASRDVWYTFTTPYGGRLKASTCPTGTAPPGYSLMTNTVLSLHNAPCGTEIACNNDHTPVPAGCGTQLSTINNFQMAGGATAWIRVAGTNSSTFGAGQLTVSYFCLADFDDGSGTGSPDGGVDISDLLYFLALFDAGNVIADVDDGSGTGTQDGGVDISDLLYFLFRFDLGC